MLDKFKRHYFEANFKLSAGLMKDIEKVIDDPKTDPQLKSDLESLNRSFQKDMNPETAKALEETIKNDPAFAQNLRSQILKDPKSIENILPKAIAQPSNLRTIVAGTFAAAPQAAAPKQDSQGEAAPVSIAASQQPAPQKQPGPAPAATTTRAAPQPASSSMEAKVDTIFNAEGLDNFLESLNASSPETTNLLMQQMDPEASDPAKRALLIDGLHQRVTQDSQFFVKLDDAFKMNKGLASTMARNLIDNPERGFQELDSKMQFAPIASFFKALLNPGKGGLGGLMSGNNDMFAQMLGPIQELLQGVSSMFGKSSTFALDNPNSRVAREALAAVGGRATLQDVKTGENLPNTGPDADRAMEEADRQQRQVASGQGPGQTPGLDLGTA